MGAITEIFVLRKDWDFFEGALGCRVPLGMQGIHFRVLRLILEILLVEVMK